MRKKINSLFLLGLFILTSCAGLGMHLRAKSEFDAGLALFNRGKYEEAIPHFEKATDLEPEFAKAYLYTGRSYLNLGKWYEAVPPLRAAFRLSPGEMKKEVVHVFIDALFGVAFFELKKGSFQDAISSFREILELNPESVKAKDGLIGALISNGTKLLSEGKAADAINAFTEALELSPYNVAAYLGLARSFIENGEFLKALSVLGDVMQIDPTSREGQSLFRELLGQ